MNIAKQFICASQLVSQALPKYGIKSHAKLVARRLRKVTAVSPDTAVPDRSYSVQNVSEGSAVTAEQWKSYLTASDPETESILAKDMLVFPDFLSQAEEESLLKEVEPYMKRLRYEFDHWDNVSDVYNIQSSCY